MFQSYYQNRNRGRQKTKGAKQADWDQERGVFFSGAKVEILEDRLPDTKWKTII